MTVKELRQGLRARWFVVPFVSVHIVAGAVVCIEFAAAAAHTSRATEAGHLAFWGLAFATVAMIFPLRGLIALTDELAGSNSQLIILTGLTRWRIAVGKWLTQMALCGLVLISLLPYAIVRYFFGGVEALGNFAALGVVAAASSAMNALMIGGSGYPTYAMRGVVIAAAYLYVALPSAGLLMWSQYMGLSGGGLWHFLDFLLMSSLTLGFAAAYAFYTLCGLQLTRAHLRAAVRPWEIPPNRAVMVLFLLSPFYVGAGAAFTCGFGSFFAGALLVWLVWSLDRERWPRPPLRRQAL